MHYIAREDIEGISCLFRDVCDRRDISYKSHNVSVPIRQEGVWDRD